MREETRTKLDYLAETKSLIKSALVEKGQTVADTDTFRSYADKIRAISGGGGSGSATVYFVTFINADGKELWKMPVLAGDDCKDPITHGDISTPTKESTVQYTYTYSGWSAIHGGAVDNTLLKAVTEDKTVYAAFTESVRKYTVRFYDGDTLVKTEQVAYGGSSTYTYSKDNYVFTGWLPEPTNITGDMDCYAQLEESYAFADASWEYIANMSARGLASSAFAIGDTKTVPVNFLSGVQNVEFMIVGFDHDDLADGTGKAGISILSVPTISSLLLCEKALNSSTCKTDSGTYQYHYPENYYKQYSTSHLKDISNVNLFGMLPSDLQSVIKNVNKNTFYRVSGSTTDLTDVAEVKVWMASANELCGSQNYCKNSGTKYEYFANNNSRIKYKLTADGLSASASLYSTRQNACYGGSPYKHWACYIDTAGKYSYGGWMADYEGGAHGFCI